MRRIGRYILNAMTVISLLLCVATVVLWVRSHSTQARWRVEMWTPNRFGDVVADGRFWGYSHGTFFVGTDWETFPRHSVFRHEIIGVQFEQQPARSYPLFWIDDFVKGEWIGMNNRHSGEFVFQRRQERTGVPLKQHTPDGWPMVAPPRRELLVGAPCWTLTIAFLCLPACRFFFRRRRRGKEVGRCVVCNYDLRATPDRCPECGTVPSKA